MNRIDLYLQKSSAEYYNNTKRETELLNKFIALYNIAKQAHEDCPHCSPKNVEKWRKAYEGTLNALKQDGTESERKSRQLKKMAFEIVESMVDNSLPMVKISPRYKDDLPLVNITENYLKFEADRILPRYENDKSERATYIDGTGWYKVWWDSLDNKHERSGNVKIDFCTVDQIYPQPGVTDYKQLEYIFERRDISATRLYDLYGRLIRSNKPDGMVEVISCYYLNENRIVGLFMWAGTSGQVICNEKDWQIRKIRKCRRCSSINPTNTECHNCGYTRFIYENLTEEVLEEDLMEIYNPYEVGETNDENLKDHYESRPFLTAGTTIPFYRLRQLPFVPRPAISTIDSIYGVSEVKVVLDMQDAINKVLTKAVDKTMKSGAVVTKPAKMKISDTDDTFKVFGVKSLEEAQQVQSKQILADTNNELTLQAILYDNGKSASGITDSFQGKHDTTATSGKAKQYAAMQSAGRIESLRVMKSAAFAGVYELLLKYLLAFSDEPRKFVKILPDGKQEEQTWNKYMFLAKDKHGEIYYRDDFTFSTDGAASLSQNRAQMWQETQDKFVQGAFGNPQDPRALSMFWNTMNSLQYPLANIILAGIKESEQHLPFEIEQAIMQNPEIMQMVAQMLQGADGRGGARPNSGPAGNGATHAANVERTNERNRASNRETLTPNQQGGNV